MIGLSNFNQEYVMKNNQYRQYDPKESELAQLDIQANKPPQYQHDCKECKFLGQSEFGKYDLYFCEQSGISTTLIARFSDEGRDYKSGLCFVGMEPVLTQAYKLARIRNLI